MKTLEEDPTVPRKYVVKNCKILFISLSAVFKDIVSFTNDIKHLLTSC